MLYTLRNVYLTYVFMLLIGSYNVFCMNDKKNINESSVSNSLVEQSGEEVDSEADNSDVQEAENPYERGRKFVQQAVSQGMNYSKIVEKIAETEISYDVFVGVTDQLEELGIDPGTAFDDALQHISEKKKNYAI